MQTEQMSKGRSEDSSLANSREREIERKEKQIARILDAMFRREAVDKSVRGKESTKTFRHTP